MMAKEPSLQTFVYRSIFKEDYHLVKILYKYKGLRRNNSLLT